MTRHPLLVSLLVLPLLGAGCLSISTAPKKAAGGGVFQSTDKGATWVQKVALPTAKGVQSISGVDVTALAFDEQDSKALYIGTAGNGLFYSYDAGDSWQRSSGMPTGNVSAIAVDPKQKCTIYAAVGNRLLRSVDCGRAFDVVYTDARNGATLTALSVDWFNTKNVYIATETGDLIRSSDSGATWSQVHRWDAAVKAFVISRGDSRKMWVATNGLGISLSEDGGATWQDLRKTMDTFDGARQFYALAEDRSAPGHIIHASRFGLLESADSGHTWQKVNILTPPQSVTITALAMSPKNGKEIYYTTATKLYKSKDGGVSWATSDLPTTRVASVFAVDPNQENVLYLGVVAPKQ
jgi:photosystem II stability/assembly factor-like uncharacterized protein